MKWGEKRKAERENDGKGGKVSRQRMTAVRAKGFILGEFSSGRKRRDEGSRTRKRRRVAGKREELKLWSP